MFLFVVEIQHLRQLERLQPGTAEQIVASLDDTVDTLCAERLAGERGVYLYRIPAGPAVDAASVIEVLRRIGNLLRARSVDLYGWSVILDDIEFTAGEIERRVESLLRRLPGEDQVWLSQTAYAQLGARLTIEPTDADGHTIYRVVSVDRPNSPTTQPGPAEPLEENVDRVLDLFDLAAPIGRRVLVHTTDGAEARGACAAALSTLYGDSAGRPMTLSPLHQAESIGPLVSALDEAMIAATPDLLSAAERACWQDRLPIVRWAMGRGVGNRYPTSPEREIDLAFELYLTAYARQCRAAAVPAVLVIEDVHEYSADELALVAHLLSRVGGGTECEDLCVLATSAGAGVGAELRTVLSERLRLRAPGRVRKMGSELLQEERSALSGVYLAVAWGARVLGPDLLSQFLSSSNVLNVEPSRAIEDLVELGAVRDRWTVSVVRAELAEEIAREHPSQARELRVELAAFVVDAVGSGAVRLSEAVLELLQLLGHVDEVPRLFHLLVGGLLIRGRFTDARRLLYSSIPSGGFRMAERQCLENVVQCNRIALAVATGDLREAARNETLLGNTATICRWLEADAALTRGRYLIAVGERGQGVALLKQGLIRYQDDGEQEGLARANIDFGVHLLANQDMLGAREYFGLGAKDATSVGSFFERLRAELFETQMLFVTGNYSRVLDDAAALAARAGAAGLREWQLHAEFLVARAQLELGRYEAAADLFLAGRSRARLFDFPAADELHQRWFAKAVIYDNRAHLAVRVLEDLPETRESLYFLGEAYQQLGDSLSALDVLSRALEAPRAGEGGVFTVSWQTGFSMLEDRVIREFPVLAHQIMALRAYTLAQSGDVEGGVRELYRLTKEVQTSEIDPFNSFYYFLYGSILPEHGPLALEDRTTILGRAVRFIQDRSSRIDRYADKADFMRSSYWNHRLISRASQLNLV